MTSPVPASEFSRNIGRYQDQAMTDGVVRFLSPVELDRYERLKLREREVMVVGAVPDNVVTEIAAAEYGAGAK